MRGCVHPPTTIIGVARADDEPGVHQALKALGEDVRGDALVLSELREPAASHEEHVPQDEQGPSVAEQVQRSGDRAGGAKGCRRIGHADLIPPLRLERGTARLTCKLQASYDMDASNPPNHSEHRWQKIMAIAATGGFAGGGLLIGVGPGSRWLGMDPMVWQTGFWSEFIAFAVAIVPLFLLSFIGMFLSRRTDIDIPEARWWWTAGLMMWGVNCLITSVYHLPVNLYLQGLTYTAAEAETVRTTWLALHVPRVLLAIGTHLAAVQAALIASAAHGAMRGGR